MPITQFTIRLTTLKVVKQSDRGSGGSEPYLWVTRCQGIAHCFDCQTVLAWKDKIRDSQVKYPNFTLGPNRK